MRPASAAAQVLPLAKVDPVLVQKMLAAPLKRLPVIVEMDPPAAPFSAHPKLERAVRALDLLRLYGRPVGALPLLNAAAGFADSVGIQAISLLPGVAYIYLDDVVTARHAAEATYGASGQLGAVYPRLVGADRAWSAGLTGQGVGVAVLDSGIALDPDLTQPVNRVVASVNFAGPRPTTPDPGGHGTHVAGIVAGNGTRSAGEYVGVAPEARLVDVRVLDEHGVGRVSSVVAGIEWAIANRNQYGIRVLNLSLGAPARRSYRQDPFSAAVEIAWKSGLVVVVAAGNDGPNRGTVQTPGIDPYVVTVGAIDDAASPGTGDDVLAPFSSWGTPDGRAKPDLVAPGRRIVSIRTPGSYLDTLHSDRVVTAKNGSSYFRLSGTSAATPMVAGAVALLLQRQPGLSPDQVKAILMGTTQPLGGSSGAALPDPDADGTGLLDAYAVATSGPRGAANADLRPSSVAARSLYSVLYGQPLVWQDPLRAGLCLTCLAWATLTWADATWDNLRWDAFNWKDGAWDDGAWDDGAWDDGAWDDGAWDDGAWDTAPLD
jgi:serine protease AprX